MFDELLRIKAQHEQTAAGEVLRYGRLVEERAIELEHLETDLKGFHIRRIEQEQQLFENIRGTPVGLKALDDMRQQVDLLHLREARLKTDVLEAKKHLQEAKQELDTAQDRHKKSARELEKFKQLVAVQREAEARASMHREELEMEEIVEATYHPHRDHD